MTRAFSLSVQIQHLIMASPVILSVAKNPTRVSEILRCAQGDNEKALR